MRRGRYTPVQTDDATGLAGWMYSDLLLGLMVVFLATISFVPGDGRVVGKPDVAYSYARVHPVEFSGTYRGDDATQLIADVARFKTEQQLPGTAYITKAQFIGMFDPATETKGAGSTRALTFIAQIDAADPSTLRLAATIVRAVQSETPQVMVRFTLASEIQVVNSP